VPRSRATLTPLAPGFREEDDGTWMLTFSDLVLLLLAFVAIGIMMERAEGPHRIARHLRVAPVAPAAPAEPFVLVTETDVTEAPPPSTHLYPAPPPARAELSDADAARLRILARRLETRLAAEGVAGLRPAVVERAAVVIEVAGDDATGRGTALAQTLAELRPQLLPPAVTVVAREQAAAALPSESHRALARATRVAHELVDGDPLLAVHVTTGPATDETRAAATRVEVRLVGG
jgi:hypothetical protein